MILFSHHGCLNLLNLTGRLTSIGDSGVTGIDFHFFASPPFSFAVISSFFSPPSSPVTYPSPFALFYLMSLLGFTSLHLVLQPAEED